MPFLSCLFSPVTIGGLRLKNRLVMSPMALNYADDRGNVTRRQLDYYAARARGGSGLIISESLYVLPEGRGNKNRLGLCDDTHVAGHRDLTEVVHQNGGLVFAQLHHGGITAPAQFTGQVPVGPSAVALAGSGEPFIGIVPRRMNTSEIGQLVQAFAAAARRAKQSGYDGVQIHAAHGYLISEFLSPRYNRRDDQYGGSDENRSRLLLEIIAAIRRLVGDHYPISVRITARETFPGGYGLEFTCWLVGRLEPLVDEICVSGGTYDDRHWISPPMVVPEGFRVEDAAAVKKSTRLPVGVVGRITDPAMADGIIRDQRADLVYMGRALLADPDLPNKARDGQLDRIRPCIGCNSGCINRIFRGLDVRCAVNPITGQEGEAAPAVAGRAKKILVAGGGPAGLQAAATAAGRGHLVTLVEKSRQLSWKIRIAAVPPGRQALLKIAVYLEGEARRAGVEIKTGIAVTQEYIRSFNPDALILAVGAKPVRPAVPGVSLAHVVVAEEVLEGRSEVGKEVVVIGGGKVGMETAELLASGGRPVSVLEMTDVLAGGEDQMTRKLLLERVNQLGVRIFTGCRVDHITVRGVAAHTPVGLRFFPAETVVLAAGYAGGDGLVLGTDVSLRETYIVGDCKHPGNIMEAISEGFKAGITV